MLAAAAAARLVSIDGNIGEPDAPDFFPAPFAMGFVDPPAFPLAERLFVPPLALAAVSCFFAFAIGVAP
jgi:hypothetical protein